MSLFNVAYIIVNRVQSEFLNNQSSRDRGDPRNRDKSRDEFRKRDKRD